jgi:nitrite reductase (NADH) large subunit
MEPVRQSLPAESAPAPAPVAVNDSDRIVVVGSGPVGVRFAESVAGLVPGRSVLLLGDEPFRPYDRVQLSSLVAREMVPDGLITSSALDAFPEVEVLVGRRVIRIDRDRKTVEDERGEIFRYTNLVLATGSRPRLPPIPGLELSHVYTFRNMRDAECLLARQVGSRSVVVIGGGLLGLEAARAMRRFGTEVTVVEHESRLMFHQLDLEAAALLQAHIERLGIHVCLGESVQQIVGLYSPEFVRLKSGLEIDCDSVVLATGIAPNVEIALEAGLAVKRGIRVDDSMLTSDASIYAIGECAEHREQVYGLVGPGLEQAGVAANHVAGRTAEYRGSIVATSLKVVGCSVFSMGEAVDSARPFRAQVFRSENTYRRINVYRGRIIGAVGFGDWDVTRLRAAGFEPRRIWPWQLWRFRRTGRLWPAPAANEVAGWPATATVCTCRGVTRRTLDHAIAAGATSIASLASATGAATVCGSCKPLLGRLIGAGARPQMPRTLVSVSTVSLALGGVALLASVPYATSMSSDWRLDALWTTSLPKQFTGFSLFAIAVVVSLLSFRKRMRWVSFAKFSSWQIAHAVIGLVAIFVLFAHTGFRTGAHLNAWLMLSFTGLIVAGGLAGTATAMSHRYDGLRLRQLKIASLWAHIFLLWPLPALLGVHVLKGYYF